MQQNILFKRTDNRVSYIGIKGSMSVEAAVVFPIFFFCTWMLWQLFLMIFAEVNIYRKVTEINRGLADAGYIERQLESGNDADLTEVYKAAVIAGVFSETNDHAFPLYVKTKKDKEGFIIIETSFIFKASAPIVGTIVLPIKKNFMVYPCVGSDDKDAFAVKEKKEEKKGEEEYVYITDNGEVYHAGERCTFLTLSTEAVTVEEVVNRRNEKGHKYSECKSCNKKPKTGTVYITNFGEKYHYSLECKGLKRNMHKVKLSEVSSMSACPKCLGSE